MRVIIGHLEIHPWFFQEDLGFGPGLSGPEILVEYSCGHTLQPEVLGGGL